MEETTAIIVATIVGAGIGAVGSWLTERARRRSERASRLFDARLEIYADLLQVAARIGDNVQTWAIDPRADLEEHDNEFLNRMLAELEVTASEKVLAEFKDWKGRVEKFHRARERGGAPQHELGRVAAEIVDGYPRLRAAIRHDARSGRAPLMATAPRKGDLT